MNIDPKKLLLPAKNKKPVLRSENFLVPIKSIQYKNTTPIPTPPPAPGESTGGIKKDLLIIREKVIYIEDILKASTILQKKNLLGKNRQLENTRRSKKETELEKKPDKKQNKLTKPSLPGFGILSAIKNFIENTISGIIFTKLLKYLPQIIEFSKNLTPIFTFVGNFMGGMADKLITFIDLGYKAYDTISGAIKNIGGENVQKTFDDFSGKLNTFINLAIIAGLAATGGTDFKNKKAKGPNSKTGKPPTVNDKLNSYLNRSKETKLIERKFGNDAARYYEQLRSEGKNSAQAFKDLKKRFQPKGIFNRQTVSGLAGAGQTEGKVFGRGIQRSATRGAVKVFGKTGAKVFGRLPIVGPLLDFGIRVYLGEKIGRAAAAAVGAAAGQALGSWLGGTIGGIAGSVVPIVGNLLGGAAGVTIGGLIGGVIGDQIGVSLYDSIVGQETQTEGRAQGGQISTRGGKRTGGVIGRTFKAKRTLVKPAPIKVAPVNPGKDIGGIATIEKIYNPDVKDTQISSFRVLKNVSSIFKNSSTNFMGQLMGVGVDLALGQKPDKSLYNKFGQAFGGVVQELIDNNVQMSVGDIANSILAMANGGVVPPNSPASRGGDFGSKLGQAVAYMFSGLVENQATLILKALKIESNKEPYGGGGAGGGDNGDLPPGTASLTGNTNAEKVFNYLIGYGFTPQAAAGVVGNLMQESGVNPNSHQNGGGKGRGMMQWGVDERWAALTAWAQSSGKDPWKLDTQVEWMMREMKQRGTLKRLPKIKNVKAAVDLFEDEMEDAGTPMMANRYVYAADALASFGGGGAGGGIVTGAGYGSAGGKIAGELGRFIKQHLKSPQQFLRVTEHPEHGGVGPPGVHEDGSLHYSGRAIDIGANAHEQGPILKVIRQFNELKGVKPAQVYHAGNDADHQDHVHVAYSKGGLVSNPTKILVGERGPEYIFDADTTRAINYSYPGILAKLNYAKSKIQVESIIQSYASYNKNGSTTVIVPIEKHITTPKLSSMGSGSIVMSDNSHIDNRMEAALS